MKTETYIDPRATEVAQLLFCYETGFSRERFGHIAQSRKNDYIRRGGDYLVMSDDDLPFFLRGSIKKDSCPA